MLGARRQARIIALQALYEIDCSGHTVPDVLSNLLEDDPLPEGIRTFTYDLVNGVLAHQHMLDRLIHQYAPEWPVDQMAVIDRNILRIAIYEIADLDSAPLRVVINEAVELAKEYGADTSPRFVNGVLGSLAVDESAIKAIFASQDVSNEL